MNLSDEIFDKEHILLEHDFQTGAIEYSMTGELIPLERVEVALREFMQELKKKLKLYNMSIEFQGIRQQLRDHEKDRIVNELAGRRLTK